MLVPHFKDEYWLSVGYGLEQAAKRHDVALRFFEAGGYQSRETQIQQLGDCAASDVDAILLGAVSSDHPDLLSAVSAAGATVPVFGLVNELHAPDLAANIGVDWYDMGHALGGFLAARHPAGSAPKTAVLISGPPESGWVNPLETGLRDGLADSSLRIIATLGADTGMRQQLALVEEAFAQAPRMDYLIGSAPAIEAAIGLLENQERIERPGLVSTYISHTVKRGLLNGKVLAVPFDDPMMQGIMTIEAAVGDAPSNTNPVGTGPDIVLLTGANGGSDRVRLSPSDYFPRIE